MPATSLKQKKFMDAVAHNPAFAKKAGVPVKVAKEFSKASKGQTFKGDGEMKESKAMVKKEVSFMKTKGAPKSMVKHEMKEADMKKMAGGGMPMVTKDGQKVPAFAADGKGKMANGGITKAKMGKVPSGGSKGKGEHAIQSKGISKGKQVKMSGSKPLGMKMGGKTC